MKLALTLAAMIAVGSPAIAQQACGPHDDVVAYLGSEYDEMRRSLGLTSNGSIIEVFVSEAGTWTIVITDVSGKACLAAAGTAWQDIPVVSGDPT